MRDPNKLLMVALGQPIETGGVPTVIIGVPKGADDHMRDTPGMTHTVDLRKLGIPATLMLYAGADHEDCVATLQSVAQTIDAPFVDHRGKGLPDLGVEEPTNQ